MVNNHPLLRKDLEFSKSSIFKRKKKWSYKDFAAERTWTGTTRSRILGLSTWAICELTNAAGKRSIKSLRPQRTTVQALQFLALALRNARVSTRSFRFALFKYKYNIHLAFVNIGWYLARDMALGAHGWPRRYLPRLRLGKYVDSVNRAHLGPYGTR